jgi:hypothetical protein
LARVFFLERAFNFFPLHRRGDRRMLTCAKRVNSDGGLVLVVLAPIDKDFAGTKLLAHIGDHLLGVIVLEQLR